MNQNNTELKQKRKILCLHGWATNSKVFQYQLRQLIKEFPELEFDTLNGPISLSTNKVDNRLIKLGLVGEEEPVYSWFNSNFNFEDGKYDLCHRGNEKKRAILWNIRVFARIIYGFFVMQQIRDWTIYSSLQGQPWWSVGSKEYDKTLYSIKSLHIIGINDFLLDLSVILAGQYLNPFVIYHNQGHKMPTLTYEQLKKLRKFFKDEKQNWIQLNNLPKL